MLSSLPPLNKQHILAIYAHPDDECYCSGGTLAKYAEAGATTTVISATKGQAGQINDTRVATRLTLGAMREKELSLSCAHLGVKNVECWDYMDGALNGADMNRLIGDVVNAIRRYRPHVVITFGEDGAYGHPDHIAISEATTRAFEIAGNPNAYPSGDLRAFQPSSLYHAYFPERRMLLRDQLAKWLIGHSTRFHGTLDFVHGLSVFAEESTMLHYANDFINIRWYPPGFCIIEQGEAASDLFMILSGTVEVTREEKDGSLTYLADLTMGDFFGEIGVATQHTRNAHVIAKDTVTCMVFSPGEPSAYVGRGSGANFTGTMSQDSLKEHTGHATHMIDVSNQIDKKIAAISAHRTQFPVSPDMFPKSMLTELFGREYFVRIYPPQKLETVL